MKKLKLDLQQLKGAEVLTREQLKKVLGGDSGSGDGSCETTCNTGYYACCYRNVLVAYCPCVLNGDKNPPNGGTCDAGGIGSSECKIAMPI